MSSINVHGSAWPKDVSHESFRQLLWFAQGRVNPGFEANLRELQDKGYLDGGWITNKGDEAIRNNRLLLESQERRNNGGW